jgi:hypothetical protein
MTSKIVMLANQDGDDTAGVSAAAFPWAASIVAR